MLRAKGEFTLTQYHYHHVDVFTEKRFGGNQLAVFTNAEGLSTEQMQTIAREMNFSESTFVFPPDDPANDYKLRIFTPAEEVPMAGHPTVGTTYVLYREGMLPTDRTNYRLEEQVGVIPVAYDPATERVVMTQPLPTFGRIIDDRQMIADLLTLAKDDLHPDYPVQVVSCGVPFIYAVMRDKATVNRAKLRTDIWEQHLQNSEAPQIFIFSTETDDPQHTVYSRMFAPAMGIPEDPATGAASGPLGCYLVQYGLTADGQNIISEQGFAMGRPSLISIAIDGATDGITGVRIGGQTAYVGAGYIDVT